MSTLEQKKEIADWVLTLNDEAVLNQLYQFKKQTSTFNFDEEFAKGITADELKAKTTEFLKSLPWNNQK